LWAGELAATILLWAGELPSTISSSTSSLNFQHLIAQEADEVQQREKQKALAVESFAAKKVWLEGVRKGYLSWAVPPPKDMNESPCEAFVGLYDSFANGGLGGELRSRAEEKVRLFDRVGCFFHSIFGSWTPNAPSPDSLVGRAMTASEGSIVLGLALISLYKSMIPIIGRSEKKRLHEQRKARRQKLD